MNNFIEKLNLTNKQKEKLLFLEIHSLNELVIIMQLASDVFIEFFGTLETENLKSQLKNLNKNILQ